MPIGWVLCTDSLSVQSYLNLSSLSLAYTVVVEYQRGQSEAMPPGVHPSLMTEQDTVFVVSIPSFGNRSVEQDSVARSLWLLRSIVLLEAMGGALRMMNCKYVDYTYGSQGPAQDPYLACPHSECLRWRSSKLRTSTLSRMMHELTEELMAQPQCIESSTTVSSLQPRVLSLLCTDCSLLTLSCL